MYYQEDWMEDVHATVTDGIKSKAFRKILDDKESPLFCSMKELQTWKKEKLDGVEAHVPKEYQKYVKKSIEKEFDDNEKRITAAKKASEAAAVAKAPATAVAATEGKASTATVQTMLYAKAPTSSPTSVVVPFLAVVGLLNILVLFIVRLHRKARLPESDEEMALSSY